MNSLPSTTIIIPTFNSEKYLKKALSCLVAQTSKDFRVLIIDDNSHDDTLKIVNSFNSKLCIDLIVKPTNIARGAASSLTMAFKMLETPYFAMIDSDAYLASNWLTEMQKSLSHHGEIWGAPILAYSQGGTMAYLMGLEIESRYANIKHGAKLAHLSTCNLFGKTKVLHGISLSQDLDYGYDHQFSYLMNMKSIYFFLNKKTYCHHHNKSTLTGYFRQQFNIGVDQFLLSLKFPHEASRKDQISSLGLTAQIPLSIIAIAALFFWPALSAIIFIVTLALNWYFFSYVHKHKNAKLLLLAIFLASVRPIIWIAGITVALIKLVTGKA